MVLIQYSETINLRTCFSLFVVVLVYEVEKNNINHIPYNLFQLGDEGVSVSPVIQCICMLQLYPLTD